MRVEEENNWKAKVCIYQFPQIIILSDSREKLLGIAPLKQCVYVFK